MNAREVREYRAHRASGRPAWHAHALMVRDRTAQARLEAEGWEGEVEVHNVLSEDGARTIARVEVRRDDDLSPEDESDAYGADDIAAWLADDWHFYLVTVERTDGGSATMGGVELGYHFPGSMEGQLWDHVEEMLSDARQKDGQVLDRVDVYDFLPWFPYPRGGGSHNGQRRARLADRDRLWSLVAPMIAAGAPDDAVRAVAQAGADAIAGTGVDGAYADLLAARVEATRAARAVELAERRLATVAQLTLPPVA